MTTRYQNEKACREAGYTFVVHGKTSGIRIFTPYWTVLKDGVEVTFADPTTPTGVRSSFPTRKAARLFILRNVLHLIPE